MIQITPLINIRENELHFEFIRASGPGGQNVNKVATAVQLRFDVRTSPGLPGQVKSRLIRLAGRRITEEGILLIEAKRFRTQEQNRVEALERLIALIRTAAIKPRARSKTKPSKASMEKRLQEKKRVGEVKRMRRAKAFE